MATEELPAIVDDFCTWLVGQGFREEERRYDRRAFGNWLLVLARAPCRLRLVRDRSQWLIDATGDDLSDWYDIDLWRTCLEGRDASDQSVPLDDEIAFLRAALPALMVALSAPADTERCLREQRTKRADRMFGAWWRGGPEVPPSQRYDADLTR